MRRNTQERLAGKLGLSLLMTGLLLFFGCNDGGGRTNLVPVSSAGSGSTGSGSTGGGTPPTLVATDFETVDRGPMSGAGFTPGGRTELVTNDSDWLALWTNHTSQTALPRVDFSTDSIVAAFMGRMSGGSHTTEVVRVETEQNGPNLHATIREFRLAPWKPNTRNITAPFHFVKTAAPGTGGKLVTRRQALLDFEVIRAGAHSAIGANDPTYKGEIRVIRSDADLVSFYANHAPGRRPPAVNFQTEMVVAVLGGYQSSGGHTVETRRILRDEASDEIRILHRVNPYSGGAAPPPGPETPFQILRVVHAPGPIRAEQMTGLKTADLVQSQHSLFTKRQAETLVIRDQSTFQRLWTNRIGTRVPTVDFKKEQVIAAFLGEKTTGGYSITVRRVRSFEDEDLDIRIETTSPGNIATSVMTSPVHIIKTKRTHGPWQVETANVTPVP